jgi:prophage regulatory protein
MQNIAIQSLLRIKEVQKIVGLSRASIYRLINTGDFPPQIKISQRAAAWCSNDIDLWQKERIIKSIRGSSWHMARHHQMLAQQSN